MNAPDPAPSDTYRLSPIAGSAYRLFLLGLLASICCFSAGAASAAKCEQVIIAFKTHFDIGYTDMASNVVQRYRTSMIDQALKVVDQNRDLPAEQQFTWTIPGWPMRKISENWPGQTPERQQRILQALKDGRFAVHALPFTTHTELLELEDLTRGLGFASQLSQAVGLPLPRDAKMTDVPCHSWIMPTLLRHAGVDFLHLGCNAASSSPEVPVLFWWEGPDRSRLLTMYTAESYGTGLVPPNNWPYKTWLALIHTGDNHGPPTPEEVKKLLDEAKQKLPGMKTRIGRLSDFADAILAEKADLPVVRGDMPDTWIHGPMCDPAGARIARNTRPALGIAEALNTMLSAWGVQAPDAKDAIASAYEQSLLYGEHTWGGAQYWVTQYGSGTKWGYGETWKADHKAGRFQRLEDSWSEHTAYIERARDLAAPLLRSELQALADGVKLKGMREMEKIVVYNPLPWKRNGVVTLDMSGKPTRSWLVVEQELRTSLPHYYQNGTLCLVVPDLPPMGYRTFRVVPAVIDGPWETFNAPYLENEFLKVILDPERGVVKSIVDKSSGREMVDTNSLFGFGQYLYERFDSNNVAGYVKSYVKINADWAVNELGKPSMPPADKTPYRAILPKAFKLKFNRPTGVKGIRYATMEAPASPELPYAVTTKVFVYPGQPFFDLETTLHGKPADPFPEAGWMVLPVKADAPQFRLGRLGSIIDPVKDVVRGANHNLFGINTGLTITDADGRGLAICPLDSPLVSLDEPGCWKYSRDFVPKKPVAYINLFNNQWTTNFRLWNSGTWTSRVRIWVTDRNDPSRTFIQPALEARFPLQAAVSKSEGGKLPPTQGGLELSRQDVLVSAFGPANTGRGTLLRLWELAGRSGDCQVRLPAGLNIKTAQPIDLRGQAKGSPIKVQNGRFSFDLPAFAPASFVLAAE